MAGPEEMVKKGVFEWMSPKYNLIRSKGARKIPEVRQFLLPSEGKFSLHLIYEPQRRGMITKYEPRLLKASFLQLERACRQSED